MLIGPFVGVALALIYMLWREHTASKYAMSDIPASEPVHVPAPFGGNKPIPAIQQEQFLDRLLKVVAWTELLMKEHSGVEFNYHSIFRKTNPVIDGAPAYHLTDDSLHWSIDLYQEYHISNLLEIAIKAREGVTPAILKEITQKGKILAYQTCVTIVDGASEAESDGYVDVYDLPPIDTWFFLAAAPKNQYGILYCWVPNAFVDAIDQAQAVNAIEPYEWATIENLLPGQIS
ncbi:hypothetical protein [Chitinophaga qingshengii]|uniref:DUF3298 domain-containing protein n=1 Tax=Chitinophaga qingshengii TaxID=1569794 RepID=A0ABR7TX73_9BACT|nr:hypothetical protein [Chitinophaga qingshengii]MBC9935048.1 hypothetical protein [Chitinophaga qingshengii]